MQLFLHVLWFIRKRTYTKAHIPISSSHLVYARVTEQEIGVEKFSTVKKKNDNDTITNHDTQGKQKQV